ncbi:MAG: YegS/Rv2252/BmrU family lipid kinase [bacterium]
MEKHVLVVLNPVAGNCKAVNAIPRIERKLLDAGIDFDIYTTRFQYDAQRNIRKHIKSSTEEIIVVGGDGTVNEVINGIYPDMLPVRLISAGTGNDLLKMLDSVSFKDDFLKCEFEEIDMFSVNGQLGINALGIGFDGEVVNAMNKNNTPFQGIIAYMIFVIQKLLFFKPPAYTIEYNNRIKSGNYYILLVSNGEAIGGGFYLNPFAKLSDSELDLCLISDMPMYLRPLMMVKVLMLKHMSDSHVFFDRLKKIRIRSDRPVLAQLDGQLIEEDEFTVEIAERKLSILGVRFTVK